jgi:UDP-N-acetyl-D-mannosaminuronic acid dehydrogenase
MKKVCVIGLGYIGLPTAALLANKNYDVHGVDIVKSTVETINNGNIHIIEKDLDTFVKKAIDEKTLIASTEPTYADIFIIAVPTPFQDNHVPNLDYVISATKSIAPFIKENNLIILESTSPVGTTEKVKEELKESGIDISKIFIAHCPERVLPGNIMKELVNNDRIVGGINKESTDAATSFYETFVNGNVYKTDSRTAELAKLAENSFRDVNIAFANELSMICDNLEVDVWELIKLTNKHPRVEILSPGAGVGGHCIAVDPWFIVNTDKENSKLIKTARERNLEKTEWVIEKIQNGAKNFEIENKTPPTIACMGLAFKPNIDDLRESPALDIVQNLISKGHNVIAVEPNIESHDEIKLSNIENITKEADIIVFLVGHNEFKDWKLKADFDFCGILN